MSIPTHPTPGAEHNELPNLDVERRNLEFSMVVDGGIDIGYLAKPDEAAQTLMARFDEIPDDLAPQLLPRMLAATAPQGPYDEEAEKFKDDFCGVLIKRYGDKLIDDPDFEDLWQDATMLDMVGQHYFSSIDKKDEQKEVREDLLYKAMESMGLSEHMSESVLTAWETVKIRKGQIENAHRQIRTMARIHDKNPQAIRQLHTVFGIRHFARYGADRLLRQVEKYESNDPVDHLTVVATSGYDWNGAMRNFNSDLGLDEERRALEHPNGRIVFTEVMSVQDLRHQLHAQTRRTKPVDRLLILAHGTKQALQLGGSDHLNSDAVRADGDPAGLKYPGVLEQDAVVVLKSCDTGYRDGIGRVIARHVGVEVIAPPPLQYFDGRVVTRRQIGPINREPRMRSFEAGTGKVKRSARNYTATGRHARTPGRKKT